MEVSMITSSYSSAGAVLPMTRNIVTGNTASLKPFEDTLDHLKSLELESTLLLAVTFLRRNGKDEKEDEYEPSFPEIIRGKNLGETREILERVTSDNRYREELTIRLGTPLIFVSLSEEWNLDDFERRVLMLLLMQNVAPDFIATFVDCGFGKCKNGLQIGTLLAIVCTNLRDQLASRRYFSVESALIRNDLIITVGDVDDSTNILDESVCIHERFVRHILGDNNLYNTCFRYIKREKSTVNLDQVVLPDGVKGELMDCMEQYLSGRNTDRQDGIDEFYGCGTALVYMFYGPSGTGKTMMAKAMAAKFNRTIFSLTADDMREMPGSYQEIIATLFREAALQNGIVFFDECDDIFEKGTRASRALLIELEKARCVVILATNRPVDLDPALERRISMKTYFPIPEADVRLRIWQALIPPTVNLAEDVDLNDLAVRYRFTGGLIRNSIFLALTAAGSSEDSPTVITAEQIHFAAGKQTATLADERKICTVEIPTECLDLMPLEKNQRNRLKNLSAVWDRLKHRKVGLSLVITASDVSAAVLVAKGVAKECSLVVRSFDFQQVISRSQDDRIMDPVTQRLVCPMDYAFSPAAGDEAMTIFIDRENVLGNMLAMKKEKMGDIIMMELLARLRKYMGMFCIVSADTGDYKLPPEFSLHERLLPPEQDLQSKIWCSHLGKLKDDEQDQLMQLIKDYPLHLSEIDFVVRQASILSTIRRMEERPGLNELHEVLEQYRGGTKIKLLFGEN